MAWLSRLTGWVHSWPHAGAAETGFDRSVRVYLTLGIVVISVLSLSAVPMLLYEKSSCPVSEVAEPLGALLNEIETLVAFESEAASSFALTGAPAQTATSRWLRERRRTSVKQLLEVDVLGPKFEAESKHLADHLVDVDARLDDLYAGRLAAADYVRQLGADGTASAVVHDSSEALREMISARVATHRATTHAAETRAGILSVLSTVLAVVAVIAVARLGGRYRLAADREHAERSRTDVAYAEAERRRLEVERISASRDVLMRGFSHNLGNPLVAADWHLRLLAGASAGLAPAQAEAVSSAHQAVRDATKMVSDLLELARAEAGQLPVRRAPTDVGAMASQVAQEYRAAADGKGLTISAEIDDGLPLVETDAQHVRQVLANLVSNAIKYTPAGEVAVRVGAVAPNGGRPSHVTVEVSDTGPGLDEDERKRVFSEFYRADMPGAARGTGIGLAISSRLAAAIGATLEVQSQPGRGSTFILQLPVEGPADGRPAPGPKTEA